MSVARLLFVTMTNDVGSDRIVSELGQQGAACAVLGPATSYAGLSRFVERRFAVPDRLGLWASTRSLKRSLSEAVSAWRPDRVVPLDELAALLLRTLAKQHRTPSAVRDVLRGSFGDPQGYHAACHRLALMHVAARAGVRTPAFGSANDGLDFPVVVKRDGSSGSGGVTIAPDAGALRTALRKAGMMRWAKRLMGWGAGYDHGPDPILVQAFVPGSLAMHTVVAEQGRVIDGVSFQAVQSHPEKRASTILEAVECGEMADAARKVVAALGCSGFVSFDFIHDPGGAAYLIEMNPRPIGSTHLGRLFGHDLAHAFLTGRAVAPDPAAQLAPVTSVALFPKELERDPNGAMLEADNGRRHDVPWHEPRIVQAYSAYLQGLHPADAQAVRRRLGDCRASTPAELSPSMGQLSGANS